MGKARKILTGLGYAGSMATGLFTGSIVSRKVYEKTGSVDAANVAGGATAIGITYAGTKAVGLVDKALNPVYPEVDVVDEAEDENKEFLDEIANLNDLVGKYYANEIKLRHEIDRLEEENQKLKEREAKRHERLRASLQGSTEEGDQDEPNCFDVFKEEDKK